MASQHLTKTVEPPGMSRGLTLLFAIAGGVAVGNLYWAQPLLRVIGDSLGISIGAAGLMVTVTQVGYAVGVLLIVPLGDTLNRHRLIPTIMVLSAVALAATAFAPSFMVLLAALTGVGLTTVTGQLLNPMAGDLAHDDQRGRVLGTVSSGMITGVLMSRTISGLLADAFGWRAIYVAAAIITGVMAILLARAIPHLPARAPVSYGRLLASVFGAVREHRTVQVIVMIGAATFAVFTMFWSGLTFLLSSPPFSYSGSQIGLVGLAGLAGAVAGQPIGRLHDRGWSMPAIGLALTLALLSLIVASLGSTSMVILLVATVLLQVAIQSVTVLSQIRLFAVDVNARSRLNTAFVTSTFIGGAIGSALAGVLWQSGGWLALTAGAAVIIGLALVLWLTQRKGALASIPASNFLTDVPVSHQPNFGRGLGESSS